MINKDTLSFGEFHQVDSLRFSRDVLDGKEILGQENYVIVGNQKSIYFSCELFYYFKESCFWTDSKRKGHIIGIFDTLDELIKFKEISKKVNTNATSYGPSRESNEITSSM